MSCFGVCSARKVGHLLSLMLVVLVRWERLNYDNAKMLNYMQIIAFWRARMRIVAWRKKCKLMLSHVFNKGLVAGICKKTSKNWNFLERLFCVNTVVPGMHRTSSDHNGIFWKEASIVCLQIKRVWKMSETLRCRQRQKIAHWKASMNLK